MNYTRSAQILYLSSRKSALNVGVVVTIILQVKDLVIVETTGSLIPLLKNALLKAFRIANSEKPGIGPFRSGVS